MHSKHFRYRRTASLRGPTASRWTRRATSSLPTHGITESKSSSQMETSFASLEFVGKPQDRWIARQGSVSHLKVWFLLLILVITVYRASESSELSFKEIKVLCLTFFGWVRGQRCSTVSWKGWIVWKTGYLSWPFLSFKTRSLTFSMNALSVKTYCIGRVCLQGVLGFFAICFGQLECPYATTPPFRVG